MNDKTLLVSPDTVQHTPPRKIYTLAELLEGLEVGDTIPIDFAFENMPPVGQEVL